MRSHHRTQTQHTTMNVPVRRISDSWSWFLSFDAYSSVTETPKEDCGREGAVGLWQDTSQVTKSSTSRWELSCANFSWFGRVHRKRQKFWFKMKHDGEHKHAAHHDFPQTKTRKHHVWSQSISTTKAQNFAVFAFDVNFDFCTLWGVFRKKRQRALQAQRFLLFELRYTSVERDRQKSSSPPRICLSFLFFFPSFLFPLRRSLPRGQLHPPPVPPSGNR